MKYSASRRSTGLLLAGALLASIVAPTAAIAFSQSPVPSSIPSFATVRAAVTSSALVKTTPATSTILPPLNNIGMWWKSINPHEVTVGHPACSLKDATITIPASPDVNCAYGDLTASRSILLTGDSNATMWIAAFDTWGYLHHWKIIALSHSACTPWARPWLSKTAVLWGGITVGNCEIFRQNVLTFVKSYRPSFVIPVGIIADTESLKPAPPSQLQAALNSELTDLKRNGGTPLVLEPVPAFALAAKMLACVSMSSTNLSSCEVTTKAVGTSKLNIAYAAAAAATRTPLMATRPLFCGALVCPIFVKLGSTNYLVYEDGYHITHQYSQILGSALDALLSPYVPA